MGGGGSKKVSESPAPPAALKYSEGAKKAPQVTSTLQSHAGVALPAAPTAVRTKKIQLFDKGVDHKGESVSFYYRGAKHEVIDASTKELLTNALKGFFIFSDDAVDAAILIKTMHSKVYEAGATIMQEGEAGSCLFIVASGSLVVTINGNEIRQVSKGAMIGELALLYDAPRSATIKCLTEVTLWSLERKVFKSVQASLTSALQKQQAQMLIKSIELAVLTPICLMRLVSTLQEKIIDAGDVLYEEGSYSSECMLVMSGVAVAECRAGMVGKTQEAVDLSIGCYRPRDPLMNDDGTFGYGKFETDNVLNVYEGCLLGFGAIRGKGGQDDQWVWDEDEYGVLCTATVTASTTMKCYAFTVEVFQRLFGEEFFSVLNSSTARRVSRSEHRKVQIQNFNESDFEKKQVIGSGSFATVILGQKKGCDGKYDKRALKVLEKSNVLEMEQLRHVQDERKLLGKMTACPFIQRLFGTYQTPNTVVLVTELIEGGDLWSVIYEAPDHVQRKGLPTPLATFYSTCLVFALAFMHEKGVVYRDLKPENVMIGANGYLKIIDFGFAKTIPYSDTDEFGNTMVKAKSYTLCGTPEYLAPEFIFNMGHDASSDLWALGVLIYEMHMAATPFAPKHSEDVAELFINIANVKKAGLNLPPQLDQKTRGSGAYSLISDLLKPSPNERIGVQQGSTRFILEDNYFRRIDLNTVQNCSFPAPYLPSVGHDFQDLNILPDPRKYDGEEDLFDGF